VLLKDYYTIFKQQNQDDFVAPACTQRTVTRTRTEPNLSTLFTF